MPTTTKKLVEQVLYLIEGGDPKAAASIKEADVRELVGQVINQLLKVEYFRVELEGGERIPDGNVLATYENLAVSAYHGRSKVSLPAFPQRLVKGIGVFQVSPQNDWSCEYIPVPPGQFWMVQKEGLISDLLGHIGYEVYGKDLIFTKDLLALTIPVAQVMVRLAIVDISTLSDYDIVPIPADMEAQVVTEVFNILINQQPGSPIVDPTAQPIRK